MCWCWNISDNFNNICKSLEFNRPLNKCHKQYCLLGGFHRNIHQCVCEEFVVVVMSYDVSYIFMEQLKCVEVVDVCI